MYTLISIKVLLIIDHDRSLLVVLRSALSRLETPENLIPRELEIHRKDELHSSRVARNGVAANRG